MTFPFLSHAEDARGAHDPAFVTHLIENMGILVFSTIYLTIMAAHLAKGGDIFDT